MNTAKQVGQNAGDLARKIARQVAAEPLEILKDTGSQVSGSPEAGSGKSPLQNQNSSDQAKIFGQQNELQDKAKSARRMEALTREIEDIHKQDLFNDLQNKVARGEDVPVAEFTELSMEQKQVLNAQKEAVENQKQQLSTERSQGNIPFFTSKPSRRFGAGQKQEAEKQQTRVEKPVPPSG